MTTEAELDKWFDIIDDHLLAGRFGECDVLLLAMKTDAWPTDLLLTILTATAPYYQAGQDFSSELRRQLQTVVITNLDCWLD